MASFQGGLFTTIRYYRDFLLGFLYLHIGRQLPKLKPRYHNLHNKNVIITGGNSGIGYSLALQLAEMGATVYLACRNEKKASAARLEMLQACPAADIQVMELDTSSLRSVRKFAASWGDRVVDVLVHNAGMASPLGSDNTIGKYTSEGFELLYQTNFLSSFLLTHLLEPHFSPKARVVLTSSFGHYVGNFGSYSFRTTQTLDVTEDNFHQIRGMSDTLYTQTKFMQAVFALNLQEHFRRRQKESPIRSDEQQLAFSFSPGFTKTAFMDSYKDLSFTKAPATWMLSATMALVGISWDQGAATGVYLATSEDSSVVETGCGGYFDRMVRRCSKADLTDQAARDRFWMRWCADADISWEK